MANWSRLPHAAHMAHTAAALAFDSGPRQEAALSIWPQTYLVTCQKHLFPRSTVLDAEVTFVGSPAFWRKAEGYTQDGLLRSGARFPGSLPREERSCFAFFSCSLEEVQAFSCQHGSAKRKALLGSTCLSVCKPNSHDADVRR